MSMLENLLKDDKKNEEARGIRQLYNKLRGTDSMRKNRTKTKIKRKLEKESRRVNR